MHGQLHDWCLLQPHYVDNTKCAYALVRERSYEVTFGSRHQEGEEGLQDNVGVGSAVGEGYTYGMGRANGYS